MVIKSIRMMLLESLKIKVEKSFGLKRDANCKPSGLLHILDAHESDFNNKGISTEDIADFVLTAVSKGKIIGYQGKGTGRPIYQVEYYGKTYKVAVTVGSNGYIVGANPR